MYLVALYFVMLTISYLARRSGLPRVNTVSILTAAWLPVMTIASLPGAVVPGLSDTTWSYIFIGLMSWSLGALGASWLRKRLYSRRRASRDHWQPDWAKVARAHWLLLGIFGINAVLQIATLLPAIQAAGGFHALFNSASSSAGSFKIGLVAQEAQSRSLTFSSTGIVLGVLNYLTFLGRLSIFTGALLWIRGRRVAGVAPLIIAALLSFLSLERTTFALSILLFVLGIYGFRRSGVGAPTTATPRRYPKRRLRMVMVLLLTGLLGAVVLLVPLKLRNANTGRTTGWTSVGEYVTASVAGLNIRVSETGGKPRPPVDVLGQVGPDPGNGSYTFTNLFAIAHRLGLPVKVAPGVYDYFVVELGGRPFTTNTATSFYDFLLDFGYVGLIGIPLCFGALVTVLQRMHLRSAALWTPMASVVLGTAAWSFFVNAMIRDVRYLFLGLVGSKIVAHVGIGYNTLRKTSGAATPAGSGLRATDPVSLGRMT